MIFLLLLLITLPVNAQQTFNKLKVNELTGPIYKAATSAGLTFKSNSNTSVADFGAGGGSGATFFGGVNIDGATRLATSLTGPLKASSGAVTAAAINLGSEVTGVCPVANGCTGKALTLSAGGVPYFDSDSFEVLSASVSGYFLRSGGTSAPTFDSPAAVTAALDNFTGDAGSGGVKGLVPAPAAGDAATNKFLKANGTWTALSLTATRYIAILQDVKANNTTCGNASSSYVGRNLNTIKSDSQSIIINSGDFTGTGGTNAKITLAAGTYKLRATSFIYRSGGSVYGRLRVRNTSDSSTIDTGLNCSSTGEISPCFINTVFTLASQKDIEVQQDDDVGGTNGFGIAVNNGDVEKCVEVEIEKI